jgi:hypothetical protein
VYSSGILDLDNESSTSLCEINDIAEHPQNALFNREKFDRDFLEQCSGLQTCDFSAPNSEYI